MYCTGYNLAHDIWLKKIPSNLPEVNKAWGKR